MHHAGERIGHRDVVAGYGETRTRQAPFAVHGVGFGDPDGLGDLAADDVELMEIAVLGEDVGEAGANRIGDEMHATGGEFNQAEDLFGTGFDDHHLVRPVIADEVLHAPAADKGGGLAVGQPVIADPFDLRFAGA